VQYVEGPRGEPADRRLVGRLSGLSGLSGSFGFFGLFGSFGFFGFPISQPIERDKLHKPNKRNEPVSAVPRIPTAMACGLKNADPAAELRHVIT
jgi:hypothetical protein